MSMVSITKVKNVKRGESVFRIVLGVALIVIAFCASGITGLVLALIGVAFILTAFLGYWPWKGIVLKVFSRENEKPE
jgi:predicted phage tail protein